MDGHYNLFTSPPFLLIKFRIIFIRHLKLLLFFLSYSPVLFLLAYKRPSPAHRLAYYSTFDCCALCLISLLLLEMNEEGGWGTRELSDLSVQRALFLFYFFLRNKTSETEIFSFPPTEFFFFFFLFSISSRLFLCIRAQ